MDFEVIDRRLSVFSKTAGPGILFAVLPLASLIWYNPPGQVLILV